MEIINISLNSKDPVNIHKYIIPINNPISPNLFIIIAFIADLLAWILVYQKLINKYEHNPTPSHPIKSWIKLELDINIIIKKVNRDK